MNAIESLAALRAQLQEQDDELTSSIETLERERTIVRRQLALVQELVDLQDQRDTAGHASDGEPARSTVGKAKAGAKATAASEPSATTEVAAASAEGVTEAVTEAITTEPDAHAGDEPDRVIAAEQGPAAVPEPAAEPGTPAESQSDEAVAAAEALAAAEADALAAASATVEAETPVEADGTQPATPESGPALLARAPIPWPRNSGEPETGLLRRMRAS